jgi:hypothetical protein
MYINMLRRFLAGAFLVAFASGLVLPVSAEAAVVKLHITGVVKMHLYDPEDWNVDPEVCDLQQPVDFIWSSNSGTAKFYMVGYCGGEVRAEIYHSYNVLDHPLGIANLHIFGLLYEGTNSHTTMDEEDRGWDDFSFDSPKKMYFELSSSEATANIWFELSRKKI